MRERENEITRKQTNEKTGKRENERATERETERTREGENGRTIERMNRISRRREKERTRARENERETLPTAMAAQRCYCLDPLPPRPVSDRSRRVPLLLLLFLRALLRLHRLPFRGLLPLPSSSSIQLSLCSLRLGCCASFVDRAQAPTDTPALSEALPNASITREGEQERTRGRINDRTKKR